MQLKMKLGGKNISGGGGGKESIKPWGKQVDAFLESYIGLVYFFVRK